MQFERQQLRDLVTEKNRQRQRDSRTELRVLAQAEVPASALTRSGEWNYYLEIVQGKIEELEATLSTIQAALATDMAFDHATLAANKAYAMRLRVQIDTLKSALDLPKQIIETGEKAKLELVKYDD